MASKKKVKRVRNDYEDDPGISRPKKIPKTLVEKDSEKRLIVILENASLETIKVSICWVCSIMNMRVCVHIKLCTSVSACIHMFVITHQQIVGYGMSVAR